MTRRLICLFLLSISLFACDAAPQSAAVSPSSSLSLAATSPTQTAPAAPPQVALMGASSRYGTIIVDASGRTLYLFDIERSGVPKCYGKCAVSWPPMRAPASHQAAAPLNQELIGTATRSDGSPQLVYNGHPLYYYAGDRAPGEIKCQAVIEFGGGWYVIDAVGNKIATP